MKPGSAMTAPASSVVFKLKRLNRDGRNGHRKDGANARLPGNRRDRRGGPISWRIPVRGYALIRARRICDPVCRRKHVWSTQEVCARRRDRRACGAGDRHANNPYARRVGRSCDRSLHHVCACGLNAFGSS